MTTSMAVRMIHPKMGSFPLFPDPPSGVFERPDIFLTPFLPQPCDSPIAGGCCLSWITAITAENLIDNISHFFRNCKLFVIIRRVLISPPAKGIMPEKEYSLYDRPGILPADPAAAK